MESEESVEIDRSPNRIARRLRNCDRGSHRVVGPLGVGDDDVEGVRGTALEEADQHLSLWCIDQLHSERGAPEKARAQSDCHERQRARLHESSALHVLS